jgi:hypothetical protein
VSLQLILTLLTALSTVIAVFCTDLCVRQYRALKAVLDAMRAREKRIDEALDTVDALDQRLKRLAGKFYYERRGKPAAETPENGYGALVDPAEDAGPVAGAELPWYAPIPPGAPQP